MFLLSWYEESSESIDVHLLSRPQTQTQKTYAHNNTHDFGRSLPPDIGLVYGMRQQSYSTYYK
jgi:hypothetical protein